MTFTLRSMTLTAGTLDVDGEEIVCDGNWTMASGAAMADPGGADIEVGGNFTSNGVDLDGASGWVLTVTGTGTLHDCSITHCDASGGTVIDATDNCTNGGNNSGINFALFATAAGMPLIMAGLPGVT